MGKNVADMADLIIVDAVGHARIDALDYVAAEPTQRSRGFPHPAQWDVRVAIAAAEEHMRAIERAAIFPRPSFGADESRAQSDYSAVAPGIACRIFQSQAPTLGK